MTELGAHARLRVELDSTSGVSVLVECVSSGPLVLRRTGGRGPTPTVHLVGGAAGPMGGDRWRIEVTVGAGAALCVRSVAASIALPDRAGRSSLLEIHADLGPGARLDWAPEPLILAAGATHTTAATLHVADGATLRWREEIVCGRANETSGTGFTRLRATYAGRPLLAHDLALGPGALGWDSPAVLGSARTVGTVLLAAPGIETPSGPTGGNSAGVRTAVARLAGPGVLITAVGPDARCVGQILDDLTPVPLLT
ncbi:MAG: urease accessory protein UreD [Sporichthyaceae bacterium]